MLPSSPSTILHHALRIAIPLSVVLTFYLYLYPVFSSCGFPLPPAADGSASSRREAFWETVKLHLPLSSATKADDAGSIKGSGEGASGDGSSLGPSSSSSSPSDQRQFVPRLRNAPFRLLALGDPQLEGDTSIPNTFYDSAFPHVVKVFRDATFQTEHYSLRWRVRQIVHDLVDIFFLDVLNNLESVRKRIDLLGNDLYLAHIYRTLHWWTRPTHVTVLGDLLGSQWLEDDEFDARADRFWHRVVRGAERVPDDVARPPADEYDLAGYLVGGDPRESPLDPSNHTWTRRVINIAGNHDIGYAGDINEDRIARFERRFGRANYELRFEMPMSALSPAGAASVHKGDFATEEADDTGAVSDRLVPELRIVVLNDMNLDTPANSSELQDATYNFINGVINTASAVEFAGHFTIVLTHVPLHKPEGVCVDSPLFEFHEHDGSLKEQNMLSADASRGFLEGILGMSGDTNAPANGRGRKGVILNGHDHAGCDTYHFINQSQGEDPAERAWEVRRWRDAVGGGIVGRAGHPGVREITVRSMMGDFGGNAGLLSAWFDEETWEWRFEYAVCPLGRQHLWWLVHILDLLVILALVLYPALALLEAMYGPTLGIDRLRAAYSSVKTGDSATNGAPPTAADLAVADIKTEWQYKTESFGNGSIPRPSTAAPGRGYSS